MWRRFRSRWPTLDFSPLVKMFEDLHRGEYHKDFENFVYERAAECIYGPGYFKWRNTVTLPGDEE